MPTKPQPIETTVTFLEMHAPPAHYPPLPSGPNIALLRTKDIPAHFYRYLIDRVGRKWNWVNALRLSDAELAEGLAHVGRDIRVLYLDGAPAGFFDVKPHLPDHCELGYFGLMEHATGMGLGRWFLGAAVAACWAPQPPKITVQTCTLDHPAALPLYQKLGFSPVAQKTEQVVPLTPRQRADVLARE